MNKFESMAKRVGEICALKNASYGDSFSQSGEVLRHLYPNGIRPEQYRDALGTVRVIDKLFRIANRKSAFGESPWRDIAGYGVVAATADAEASEETLESPALRVGARVAITTIGSSWYGYPGEIVLVHEGAEFPFRVRFIRGQERLFSADELEVLP